jgi:hypothetical protein
LEEALLEAKKNEAPSEASFVFFAWCFLEVETGLVSFFELVSS